MLRFKLSRWGFFLSSGGGSRVIDGSRGTTGDISSLSLVGCVFVGGVLRDKAARRGRVAFSRSLFGGRKDGEGGALDIPRVGQRRRNTKSENGSGY